MSRSLSDDTHFSHYCSRCYERYERYSHGYCLLRPCSPSPSLARLCASKSQVLESFPAQFVALQVPPGALPQSQPSPYGTLALHYDRAVTLAKFTPQRAQSCRIGANNFGGSPFFSLQAIFQKKRPQAMRASAIQGSRAQHRALLFRLQGETVTQRFHPRPSPQVAMPTAPDPILNATLWQVFRSVCRINSQAHAPALQPRPGLRAPEHWPTRPWEEAPLPRSLAPTHGCRTNHHP